MNPTPHVTNLELSKELYKHLGMRDTIFCWEVDESEISSLYTRYSIRPSWFNSHKTYPAYTASELGDILLYFPFPASFKTKWYENGVMLEIGFSLFLNGKLSRKRNHIKSILSEYELETVKNMPSNETEARAKMLLYLLDNKIIKNTDL